MSQEKWPQFARRGEPAQSMVEFAFALPIVLVLFVGILEFGWAISQLNTLNYAAMEGARRGMVLTRSGNFGLDGNVSGTYAMSSYTCNRATIVGTVRCSLGTLDPARTRVFLNTPVQPGGGVHVVPGVPVEVRVEYSYAPVVPGFFPFLTGKVLWGTAETKTQ